MTASFRRAFSFFLLLTCPLAVLAESGNIHTFTNATGQTLEAEVLDFRDGKVIIRRLSDGKNFELPGPSLSPPDKDFMRAWIQEREKTRNPAGWHPLRIHLPEFADQVEAPGIPEAFRRTGLREWEAELPDGAWVLVRLWRTDGRDFAPEFLLPFSASNREWFLSFENNRLYLSSSAEGTRRVLAGISIQATDGDNELRAMKAEIPDSGAAIYSSFVDADDLSILRGSSILSLTAGKIYNVGVAASQDVRALRVTDALDSYEGLAGYNSVEFLDLQSSTAFPLKEAARLKSLRTLIVQGKVQLADAAEESLWPSLRHLSLAEVEIEDPDQLEAFFTGLNDLESLSLPHEITLNIACLANSPKITVLALGDECHDPGATGLSALKNLTTVLLNRRYDPVDLAPLVTSGHLAKVRVFRTAHPVAFGQLPDLKTLLLTGGLDTFEISAIKDAPALVDLRVVSLTEKDLQDLSSVGAELGIRSLSLNFPNCASLAPLSALPKLEFLSVQDQLVTFDEKLESMDTTAFPALQGIELTRLQNLGSVTLSAPAESNLGALAIKSCGALTRITAAKPLPRLRDLLLANCDSLNKIEGLFSGNTLETLHLSGAPKLASPADKPAPGGLKRLFLEKAGQF